MADAWPLIMAWLAGAALVILFLGGLWWTIAKAVGSPRPALWFGMSLLLRMSAVLGGIYLVGRDDWPRILACLAGFIMVKPLVLWATRLSRRGGSACI